MNQSQQLQPTRSLWSRLLYMLLFALVFSIGESVLYLTSFVCFLSALFQGEVDHRIRRFGKDLGAYLWKIAQFLTFNSETVPWPFSPWSSDGPVSAQSDAPERTDTGD